MTITVDDLQTLVEMLETDPDWRARFRLLLVDDLLREASSTLYRVTLNVRQLTEAYQRTEERLTRLEAVVAELAEAQRRAEERLAGAEERLTRLENIVAELAEAQRRAEERLAKVEERLAGAEERLTRLETAIQTLVEQVDRLVGWQWGEAGRLEGERYERLLVKRAPSLFNRGTGGATDNPFVQQWLSEWLQEPLAAGELPDEENPFLADLIWRKGDRVVVVEASVHVDRRDVQRAARRAEALRRVGVNVIGMVIGEAWVSPTVREYAQDTGVDWKVGDDCSEGWIAFRRLAAA
ncbi:MAG: hypothetical protein H5T61_04395 [Thermoflexales bacterium]|nr:hypothetical protein [Thermoflexales bacterium]